MENAMGYAQLACMLGRFEDLAIFRQFRSAYTWNLLSLQAEVIYLFRALGSALDADRAHALLSGCKPQQDCLVDLIDSQSPVWPITLQLRSRLKDFGKNYLLFEWRPIYQQYPDKHTDEAKGQFQRAIRSPPPKRVNLDALNALLHDPEKRHRFLHGLEADTWSDEADLTSLLDSGENDDTISRWINDTLLGWFHKHVWYRFKKHQLPLYDPLWMKEATTVPLDIYPESAITTIVTSLSTILASLLPCLSIFLLYYVRPPLIRLSIILILTMLFSIAMALVAKAKREACFGSTAAFAAVLVVFVGSTDNSGNCGCSMM